MRQFTKRQLALGLVLALAACGDSAGPAPLGWASIAAGGQSTCAITTTQAAYCWGRGGAGQLGNGLQPDSLFTPTAVAGGLDLRHVAITSFHACAAAETGAGYCWGSGTFGRLGTGNATSTSVPAPMAGGHDFTTIEVAPLHGCGVTTGGTAYCWGDDLNGRLGNGALGDDSVPSPVAGNHTFTTVDVAVGTACGVVAGAEGAAYCWGSFVALGNGGDTNTTVPVPVSGGLAFRNVRVGNLSACGLTGDRRIYCWGGTSAPGVLGNGGDTATTVPVTLSSTLRFVAVDVGQTHACGVAEGGAAYCWGSNTSGELGTGSTGGSSLTPALVLGGHVFTAIALGSFHSCALTADGEAYCWGDNGNGQLGDGTIVDRDVPVRVTGLP